MKLTGLVAKILYTVLLTLYQCPRATPYLVNQTIDDQFGDSLTGRVPVFWPSPWANQTSSGNYALKPDVTQVYNGTYSAVTYYPTMGSVGIRMNFTGTAVYVFFTLANYRNDGVTTLTSVNFTVDGEAPVPWTYTPAPTTTFFIYKALVFFQTNLSNTLHILDITTMGNASVYVNFDYAIYTQDSDDTTRQSATSSAGPSPRIPVGAKVGGIAGGVVMFLFVLSLLFFWNRRGQRDKGNWVPGPVITQFDLEEDNPSALSTAGMAYSQFSVHPSAPVVTPLQSAIQIGYAPGMPYQSPVFLCHAPIGNQTGYTPGMFAVQSAVHSKASLVAAQSPNQSNFAPGPSFAQSQVHSKALLVTPQSPKQMGYAPGIPYFQSLVHSKAFTVAPQSANRTGQNLSNHAPRGSGHLQQKELPALPLEASNIGIDSAFGGTPQSNLDDSHPNAPELTRAQIRRARQEELDNRLKMMQEAVERMTAGPRGSATLRRHRSLGATPGAANLSVSDMRAEVRLMREQIQLLREQRRSAWALGLSDDPPPGYTPMETRTARNSRNGTR